MNQGSRVFIGVLVVGLMGVAFFWWRKQQEPPPPPPAPVPQAVAPAPPPAPPDAAAAILHPIEAADPKGLPALAESDSFVNKLLIELLGRKSVLSFLTVDGFINRFVATVDNLPAERAAVRLWPVVPTAGRL